MNITPSASPSAAFANFQLPKIRAFSWSTVILLCLLMISIARAADTPDEKYLAIFGVIEQADTLNANGQTDLARAKYTQAQAALITFKRDNPLWSPKAVAYRLNYLADKLATNAPKSQTVTSGATTTPTQSARTEKKIMAGSTTTPLKVLSVGAEPRKALRLHPSAGDKQSLVMTTKTAMTMMMGDTPVPAMKLPGTQMNLEATVKDVAANGDITYELTVSDATAISDADVMPQLAEAMKSSLSKFRGLSGTGTSSDRGLNLGMTLNVPPNADAQTRQTLEQMKESLASTAVPFPEEAVGVGAQWEAHTKLKSQGLTIDQTTTYEVISIEDNRINLKISASQTAADQKMESPAMPGMKIDMTKLTGTGTGTILLDPTKLLPTESGMDEHTEMAMSMNLAGKKQSMTTKVDSTMHVGPN